MDFGGTLHRYTYHVKILGVFYDVVMLIGTTLLLLWHIGCLFGYPSRALHTDHDQENLARFYCSLSSLTRFLLGYI